MAGAVVAAVALLGYSACIAIAVTLAKRARVR